MSSFSFLNKIANTIMKFIHGNCHCRRREKERKRKAYEAVVMNRNTVENQCYSYESNWTRDSRSTGAFNSRFR